MSVKPWAEFTADLPDDQIEEDGEFVQYGGKSVAAAVGEILRRCGCKVSEPIYADEHGWELDITIEKRRLWCQITLIEKYLLLIEQVSLSASLLGRLRPVYLDVLRQFSRELAADPRFHDVRWFTGDEVHSGVPGALSPVAD